MWCARAQPGMVTALACLESCTCIAAHGTACIRQCLLAWARAGTPSIGRMPQLGLFGQHMNHSDKWAAALT